MNPIKALCFLTVLLMASAPLALAQGTYTQIDPVGSTATFCFGINAAGDIAGSYYDVNRNGHGFLLSGGIYTIIDYPGAQDTDFFGMNDLGQIVGTANSGTRTIGFLYDLQTQTFTEKIVYPGSSYTNPYGVNNAGKISGLFLSADGSIQGFEFAGSKYREITPPGATQTYVSGISTSGELVGFATQGSNNVDFAFSHGKYQRIVIPNAPAAFLYGINPQGTALAGQYEPSNGVFAGFLFQNKTLQTLQFPGSNVTADYGLNDAGEVVGLFVDSSGVQHGFTWTPPGDASKK